MRSHRDLDVWQMAMELVQEVYKVTRSYPAEEQFTLTSQIRRSATSIPSNIAEGAARGGNKEFVRFLYIALGSCSELETQLLISKNLQHPVPADIFSKLDRIRHMLLGLIRSLEKRL